MKKYFIGVFFALLATIGMVNASFARDFICTGRTYSGDVVQVYGWFDNIDNSDIYVARNGEALFYWYAWNVSINVTNTYWTLNGLEDGMSVIIRHPEGTSDRTYMRVFLDYDVDHEFNKASCKFYN